MNKLNKILFTVIFLVLIFQLGFLLAEFTNPAIEASNTNQNTVTGASAQVEAEEVQYTQKTVDDYSQLYNPDNELIARADEHFKLIDSKGEITFKDDGAGQAGEKIEFGDFANKQTFEVSKTQLNSQITFIPNQNTLLVGDKSVADVYVADSNLKQITDANISLDINGTIDYASFTSKQGGVYSFDYEGKQYSITAQAGDKIIFDPKNKKITGSSLSGKDIGFNLNEEEDNAFAGKISKTRNSISAKDFEIALDENGRIQEINMPNGGTYQDKENKLDYSSKEKFSIFYDGQEIKDYAGNAISINDNEDEFLINSKGLVSVNDLDKKLVYTGKTSGVYNEYDYYNSNFNVEGGEASVSNGKQQVEIKDGLTINKNSLEYSGSEASAFSVSYSIDGSEENKESLAIDYVEKDGKIQTEAIYIQGGKESIINLGNLAEQETKYQEKLKQPTLADLDSAILEQEYLGTSNVQDKAKLAGLYAARGLLAEREINSYQVGQEVFDVSSSGADRIGTIEIINPDGTFMIDGKEYTENELNKFRVSKLTNEELVGAATINEIGFDRTSNQITYKFNDGKEISEKQTILDYYSEDYKTAISYYQESQKDSQLTNTASLAIAGIYQQIGNTGSAKDQYINLLKDTSLDTQSKSLAYKGLISTYFQEGNPNLALSASFEAVNNLPQVSSEYQSMKEINKQLTKSYLETINSAINTEDATIMESWKQKVGLDKTWSEVGLDQPIISWFKEDINFATGFSRDQLSEQQKGILVMENLVDKGYNLNQIKSMSNAQISEALELNDMTTTNSIRSAIQTAFQNPDVINLANGAKQSFDFETGTGYVDKSFLDKNWAENILANTNVKTTAETALIIGVPTAIGTKLATNAILSSSIAETTLGKALVTPITTKTITGLVENFRTQSLIKNLGTENGAVFGKTTLGNSKIASLEFADTSAVKSFINKIVVGEEALSAGKSGKISIVSSDKLTGQYLLEMNGQQFLTRVAGQDVSSVMNSQLFLNPAREPLLLTSANWGKSPGEYTAYRAASSENLLDPYSTGAIYTAQSAEDAALYTMTPNAKLYELKVNPVNPFDVSQRQNAEVLTRFLAENINPELKDPAMFKALSETYMKNGVTSVTPEMKKWLMDQGYDSIYHPTESGLTGTKASLVVLDSEIITDVSPVSTLVSQNTMTPEEVLIKMAEIQSKIQGDGEIIPIVGDPSVPVELTPSYFTPGRFNVGAETGLPLQMDSAGNVILYRNAEFKDLLLKEGYTATMQDLRTASEFHGGTDNALPTSADPNLQINVREGYYRMEFRIPAEDLLAAAKRGEAIIGNLGESEIVLAPQFAKNYVSKIGIRQGGEYVYETVAPAATETLLTSLDNYEAGNRLMQLNANPAEASMQKEFLFKVQEEKLPVYSINQYGVTMDTKQLFGRRWSIPKPYEEWSNIAELRATGLPTDIQSYAELRDVANIGRAFNLNTHLEGGEFILYGAPASGKYIWTLDADGNMNIGLRLDQAGPSDWKPSPYVYRSSGSSEDKILPHPALSGGNKVFGAGEVVFENGEVSEVNAWSGHYVDKVGSKEFNENAVNAFRLYAESNGLKLKPNVRFVTSSPGAQ